MFGTVGMTPRTRWLRFRALCAIGLGSVGGIAFTAHFLPAQTSQSDQKALESSFGQLVKPFFAKNCVTCHNSDLSTAGLRVDQLDATLEDRQLKQWEAIRNRVKGGTMPPKGLPQPSAAERDQMVAWITQALEVARLRPAPKNGVVRRLTVAQYRNTLKELLKLDDDVTAGLPPDAVSREGFLNNKDTLQLSPLLTEAYFEVAEDALNRAIVDVNKKPWIQDFRVDLGAGINPAPLPEKLILGAGSQLLDNPDFVVTQPVPVKPFAFETHVMRTKFRYIEGYRGNDTVRGWRDFDSIYHAVFADMRGSGGYPKGKAYSTVPQGLLLRPAIPSEEIFEVDSTYGPKANFKISVRELPDYGRFRVTVTAAKYRDGLLLDHGANVQPKAADAVIIQDPKIPATVTIPKAGIYQVDVFTEEPAAGPPDVSRLTEGLTGAWPQTGDAGGSLSGKTAVVDSPLGKALSFSGTADGFAVPRKAIPTDDAHNVGEGDFSVAAWIRPGKLKREGLVSLGDSDRNEGWFLDIPDDKGALRFQTAGREAGASATVMTPGGVLHADTWQHVAVVVRRGRNDARIYVNGSLVGRAATGSAQFDDTKSDLQIGHIPRSSVFQGEMADVRLYRRPLEETEIQSLLQPGKQFVKSVPRRNADLTLRLGELQFIGALQPAFLVVRLEAGTLPVSAKYGGVRDMERMVLTPLAASDETAKRFATFEKRSPRLGVHLGLRRDCGSTFAPVGPPQVVSSEKPAKFVFEGAIRNFPSPEADKDNVNYLAGVREIGVRSEYTDGRDMPRLVIRSVEFEGPYYDSWPPVSHKNIFVDFDRKSDSQAYGRKIIRDFATRAYRRPITGADEAPPMAVFQKSLDSGRSFQDSVKDALLVVLTSPQFLFLIEMSKTPAPEPLDGYELASKLSYFLWNGPPDQKTLQLAAAGTLQKQLNSEAARMIADPRFSRFADEFTSQWLSLDKFQVLEPDRKKFPKLTRDTRAQLKQEPVEFVEYLIRNNLPVKNMIASDFIMANETVADYYGLGSKTDSGFGFVPVHHERKELGGVLTEGAILAGLSDGRESNPVKRGAWVARKIVAEPPNDPPPNVPPLKEETKNLTLRERLEAHRSAPACMQCHSKIDPWGVALEQFDAGGRLKQSPVDARSTLPDQTKVAGIDDLKKYLGEDRIDQVAFSVLKHLETYAAGRSLTYNELNYLKQDAVKLRAGGYRMKDLVLYVVNSAVFLEK
uniref:Cytochrome c domain-containing protein n=1 Tax=Solibacter usitatus (strain Ellin6076) TaxID=234267 RepID=Q02AS6_SOLUE